MLAVVCASCPAGKAGLAARLRAACQEHRLTITVQESDCMSGCTRQSTIAFRAPGKTAYLFGDISMDDLAELINFAQLYAASPKGDFADARPLGNLRNKAIARIPAS